MSIGDRIRKRREELGLSQAELARRIGVTQGSIGNYENGVSNPKMELMPKLFEALKTDANYLFQESAKLQEIEFTYNEAVMIKKHRSLDAHGKRMVDFTLEEEYARCSEARQKKKQNKIEMKIARLSTSAGTGDYLDADDFEQISVVRTPEAEQADFIVRVNGNSMEPTYHDDDLLFVESTPRIDVGDIGIFIVNGDSYVKEFGGDRLISHNQKYKDILLHDYDMVLCSGRVIGVAEEAR